MKHLSKTAEDLQILRKEANLTQKELAEKCGLSYSTISKYESGERTPSPKNLHKIMVALGFDLPEDYFNSGIDNGLFDITTDDMIYFIQEIESMIKDLSPGYLVKVYNYVSDMYKLNQNED